MIPYFQHPDYPGFVLFRCTPLHADLTAKGCARNFATKATIQCNRCETGQSHADLFSQNIDVSSKTKPSMPAQACVRCLTHTYRLQSGLFCTSCYNRTREVRLRKNARGFFPKKLARSLRPAYLLLDEDGAARLIDLPLCSGIEEARRIVQRLWPRATLADFEMR